MYISNIYSVYQFFCSINGPKGPTFFSFSFLFLSVECESIRYPRERILSDKRKNNQINIRYVMYRDLTNVSLLTFFCLRVVLCSLTRFCDKSPLNHDHFRIT